MLVLSRKKNEKLQIGDEVVVTILKVKGSSVQIGIEAPRSVRVLRSELAHAERADAGQASRPTDDIDGETKSPQPPTRSSTTRAPLRSLVSRTERESVSPASAMLQMV